VVLHPTRLERRVLPVVCEDNQSSAFHVLEHVLSKDVHVGDCDGADRAGRLAIVAAKPPSVRTAREASSQVALVAVALLDGK
jgi:hypothetical protein